MGTSDSNTTNQYASYLYWAGDKLIALFIQEYENKHINANNDMALSTQVTQTSFKEAMCMKGRKKKAAYPPQKIEIHGWKGAQTASKSYTVKASQRNADSARMAIAVANANWKLQRHV